MKQILLLGLFICCSFVSFGQQDGPKQITPEMQQKINADIDQLIPAFRQSLQKDALSQEAILFAIDTFRIEKLASKKADIDYSTLGMNKSMSELADSYDQLMNRYYHKLLNRLDPKDKTILIHAQKNWLAYRDAEKKLIGLLNSDAYTGGGTVYSNIRISQYAALISKRTVEIFNYYNNIIKPE